MTKEALRAALKSLAVELDNAAKYNPTIQVQVPKTMIDRWARIVQDLSEDELLWK